MPAADDQEKVGPISRIVRHRAAFPAAIGVALIVLTGAIEGGMIGRWDDPASLEDAVRALATVPAEIGEWTSVDEPIDEASLEAAQIAGYVSRRYENRRTGEAISVVLVCGPPGPISVHTPDVCFRGAGFLADAEPARVDMAPAPGTPPESFWHADFRKDAGGLTARFRILWAWSDGDTWSAASNPRFQYASAGGLYKLYLMREVAGRPRSIELDPIQDFAKVLLPELRRSLGQADAT